MSVFTVHEPPRRAADAVSDPERIVFVRDGFSFWAFLFTALWMVRYRLWLVLLIYVVVAAGVGSALYYVGVGTGRVILVGLLMRLLIGFEAGTLRRFTLTRRGWKNVAIVSGEDLEDAERRFFDAWVRAAPGGRATPSATPPAPTAPIPLPAHASDIVGLFPDPGISR